MELGTLISICVFGCGLVYFTKRILDLIHDRKHQRTFSNKLNDVEENKFNCICGYSVDILLHTCPSCDIFTECNKPGCSCHHSKNRKESQK